ncbi:hypothetical protein [Rhizobium leguminosarum]|jgi:hypothetical protein|uniref:hypothetical protein n=1 Tax=Rhizobium leguminosarum TaxID=384 RepID=UPI002E126255|nr:hypothetical protein U8Q02_43200 [Rhizobium leguminosarum]
MSVNLLAGLASAAFYLLAALFLTIENRRTRFAIGCAACMRRGKLFYAGGSMIAVGLLLTLISLVAR